MTLFLSARPRDVAAAARTAWLMGLIAFVVTVVWEGAALLSGRAGTTPVTSLVSVAATAALLVAAVACHRWPTRIPPAVYPGLAIGAVLAAAVVCLVSRDASAAGQYAFVYPVVYAAAHFRGRFPWVVAGLAILADGAVAFLLEPVRAAGADVVVVGSALVMVTLVLVTAGVSHDALVRRLNAIAAADPLTGLATRRELEQVARALLSRPDGEVDRRQGSPMVSLLLIDIDRFKTLNDTYGHPAGDAVLVHVAAVVRATVRSTDTVARLGGDELAVVLHGPPAHVVARAHTLREAIRSTAVHLDGRALAVTVSVGVAHRHAGTAGWEALYAAADQALYRAKVAGRDGVVVAPV